jgi:putative ABC transport system ATP-binding protein
MTPGASRGAALRLRELSVAFPAGRGRSVTVLENLDWDLPAGAQVALCGPSGSGKSTLLNVLSGIEPAPRGVVQWGDTDLARLAPPARDAWRRRHVGFVFQRFHLFPGLDALGNVVLPCTFRALRARRDEDERARRLLDRVGIRPDADVRKLSRGEQQRVSLVRAVFGLPRILLADEPTASLDAAAARTAFELLESLARETGATLVVATHDESLAGRLEARVALRGGRLVAGDHAS